jgi:hypothetical protein
MKASNANLKLSFYLKKNVVRNGLCPVMGRIAIDNEKVQFSFKIEADPKLWDARAGRVNVKSHHARTVNREIDKINVAVNNRFKEIVAFKGTANAGELKNAFQGISSTQDTLLKVFRENNDDVKKRVGVNFAISTWNNYENARTHLERFIKQEYHASDVAFKQLDYSFIEKFEYYLRIDQGLKPGSLLHRLAYLRKMVKIAISRGIINRDPFAGYSFKKPKATQQYLPADELEKLMKTPINSSALEFTRDMFVFSCFTGLAYIDLKNLTNHQIIKANDGSLWLNVSRQKTGGISKIPLLDIPLKIKDKYSGILSISKTMKRLDSKSMFSLELSRKSKCPSL